jgi:hypothetical protein
VRVPGRTDTVHVHPVAQRELDGAAAGVFRASRCVAVTVATDGRRHVRCHTDSAVGVGVLLNQPQSGGDVRDDRRVHDLLWSPGAQNVKVLSIAFFWPNTRFN